MKKKKLIKLVLIELDNLITNTTIEEKNKLDFEKFDPTHRE